MKSHASSLDMTWSGGILATYAFDAILPELTNNRSSELSGLASSSSQMSLCNTHMKVALSKIAPGCRADVSLAIMTSILTTFENQGSALLSVQKQAIEEVRGLLDLSSSKIKETKDLKLTDLAQAARPKFDLGDDDEEREARKRENIIRDHSRCKKIISAILGGESAHENLRLVTGAIMDLIRVKLEQAISCSSFLEISDAELFLNAMICRSLEPIFESCSALPQALAIIVELQRHKGQSRWTDYVKKMELPILAIGLAREHKDDQTLYSYLDASNEFLGASIIANAVSCLQELKPLKYTPQLSVIKKFLEHAIASVCCEDISLDSNIIDKTAALFTKNPSQTPTESPPPSPPSMSFSSSVASTSGSIRQL